MAWKRDRSGFGRSQRGHRHCRPVYANGYGNKALDRKNGVKCTVNPCNVTEPGQVESIIDQVLKEYGKIDVLANNAGIWRVGDAENFPLSDCEEVIRINLTAPFIVSETVGKEMIKQKRGNILMIASMSGMIVNTQQI